jgi:predicted DNA-binding transcriptional regulator YafY
VSAAVTRRRQKKRAVKSRSRPATYGTAIRVARILWGLINRPYGWSLEAIQNELRVSDRTLLRYVKVCREELVDARGRPIVELVRRGERRLLRLADSARAPDSTSYQALSFYFALTVLQFLDGTILKEGVDDLWERFRKGLPRAHQAQLADFQRKFYTVPYAVKDYGAFDETLDVVLRCLVNQYTMRVEYAGLWHGETRTHEFDAYTLTLYRGGLYLIGKRHVYDKIVYLAVERISEVEKTKTRFEYPKRYSPEKHTDGVFGIVDGDETEVAILIRGEQGASLLRSRRLHPTQRFTRQQGGATILTMRVRGTEELKNWILGLGPHVEVMRPADLRAEVQRAHAEAAALYG